MARTIDERGRFRDAMQAPVPEHGTMSRPLGLRRWDTNPNSPWAASSTVRDGQWTRGAYLFGAAPAFCPPNIPMMYDPTNPATWGKPRG